MLIKSYICDAVGMTGLYRPSPRAGDPLDDLMNGPIREKLGVIPENVVWGGIRVEQLFINLVVQFNWHSRQ